MSEFGPLIPLAGMAVGLVAVLGWVFTTWLRVKHGYPLENSWGKAIHPVASTETTERLRLIATENAQLRAEVASLKDRTAVLERIATDQSAQLDRQIESLRDIKVN
ncbi:hypothetical protein ACFOMD_02770 [Sphingoaurantiacus capsulatus]|uniref:Uncharacterized protein n=1 Tax=Sphingoaurantiacus capsulatus TaxID=1771310 RepID=A0ABV7X6M2_9SPHN